MGKKSLVPLHFDVDELRRLRQNAVHEKEPLRYIKSVLLKTHGPLLQRGAAWQRRQLVGTLTEFLPLYCDARESLGFWRIRNPSGLYKGNFPYLDVWDFVLQGSVSIHGDIIESLGPGDVLLTTRAAPQVATFAQNTVTLEYARGVLGRQNLVGEDFLSFPFVKEHLYRASFNDLIIW